MLRLLSAKEHLRIIWYKDVILPFCFSISLHDEETDDSMDFALGGKLDWQFSLLCQKWHTNLKLVPFWWRKVRLHSSVANVSKNIPFPFTTKKRMITWISHLVGDWIDNFHERRSCVKNDTLTLNWFRFEGEQSDYTAVLPMCQKTFYMNMRALVHLLSGHASYMKYIIFYIYTSGFVSHLQCPLAGRWGVRFVVVKEFSEIYKLDNFSWHWFSYSKCSIQTLIFRNLFSN